MRCYAKTTICHVFADDGVLIAFDRTTLQAMTDFLAESLAEVGLFLNAGTNGGGLRGHATWDVVRGAA